VLCAKADKMFMRTVQQNVFFILNNVPVTFVPDPELIRPSIPVMTHSLDQTHSQQAPIIAISSVWITKASSLAWLLNL